MIKGVIFDMDGVLFNTEQISAGVCKEIVADAGYTLSDEVYQNMCSIGREAFDRLMHENFGKDYDTDYFHVEHTKRFPVAVQRQGLKKLKGVDELLGWLKENGYKIALASTTRQPRVNENLTSAGIIHYFDAVISGEMVTRSKPDPQIYQVAAQTVGLVPNECAAVEDSINGVRSAAAAGCHTVMVPDMTPPNDELRSLATVLDSLLEVPAFIKEQGH